MREAFFVCGSEPDAEDVVQLVFLRLWESKTWTDIRNPRSYLRGAGRREARRLGQGPVGLPEGWDVADPADGPFRRVAAAERRLVVSEALRSLPPRCRRVMTLTILRGYSAAEIATECHIGVGAVEKQRSRGWERLREWFDARGAPSVWLSTLGDGGR
ncbi:RNA polymerase sigma factor [Gaopeijia maritima]